MDVITCPACSCRLQLPEGEQTTFQCPRCGREFESFEARGARRAPPPAAPVPVSAPAGSRWNAGDRVLAPWDYPWMYPGTVQMWDGDRCVIAFDDGDRGWADPAMIRVLNLGVGSRVFCRWKGDCLYYPGVIDQQYEERIHVNYDDGKEEWTTIRMVRVPTHEVGEAVLKSFNAPPATPSTTRLPAPPAAQPTNFNWVSAATLIALIVGGAVLRGCAR